MDNDFLNILLITLTQQAISIFGIAFNLSIVWITIKNKSLQNSYGYLLAIYSFCEFALESETFVGTVMVLIGKKMSLLVCFHISVFQTTWAATNACFSLFFISLDRLMALKFPIFYRHIVRQGSGKYVFALNFTSTAYICVMIYFNYFWVLANRENQVYCEPGDQAGDEILKWGLYNVIVLNLLTLFVYIAVGIIVIKSNKMNLSGSSQLQQTCRIFKSLAIIMGVIFLFYFLGYFAVQYIVPLLTSDPQKAFLYFRLFAQLVTVAGAINAPVLYFCSTEYRTLLNQHFPFIPVLLQFWHLFSKNGSTTVVPAPTSTNPPIPAGRIAPIGD